MSRRREPVLEELGAGSAEGDHEALVAQATELAEYLRQWEADLGRRERALHDQCNALDRERREFRLWMREMQYQLDAQREAIERLRTTLGRDPFEFPR